MTKEKIITKLRKLRLRFGLWIFRIVLPKTEQQTVIKARAEYLLRKLVKTYDFLAEFDTDMETMVFNCKYYSSEHLEGMTPKQLIETFYEQAVKGETSYLKHPFYHEIKYDNGRETKKLRYIRRMKK